MATYKVKQVDTTLLRLGFIRKTKGDHVRYYLFVGGRKTQVRTMISHGEREIDDYLVSRMAHEMRVSKLEFEGLLSERLDATWYLTELRRKGVIGA